MHDMAYDAELFHQTAQAILLKAEQRVAYNHIAIFG